MKLVVVLLAGCASVASKPPTKPPAYVDTPESTIDTESELTHAETAPPADAAPNFQRTGEIQETKLGSQHAAEDLVQTTLTKLYLAWGRIADRQHVDAYARRALVNEHRSTWRRARRRPEVLAATPPDVVREADEYDGAREAVWQFVQSLPPRQRAVIVLRYYEDLSEAEIADLLGISSGTVKSQASKALALLRERVPGQKEDR